MIFLAVGVALTVAAAHLLLSGRRRRELAKTWRAYQQSGRPLPT